MKNESKKTDAKTKTNSSSSDKTIVADKKITTPETSEKSKGKKEVKAKKSETKTVPYKKLPSLFRKTYSEKQLEKRILKRIYIAEDKKLVQSLFVESGKNKKGLTVYAIPQTSVFSKKETTKLKILAKEIKSQKSRIRWAPLIAVIVFIAACVVAVSLTKNILVKKGIQAVCESTFEAKCDIASVDIKIIESTFNLKGLQIANKAQPMKNLVSVDSIVFDFDLQQLLRAKFVANELSVTGVATNTDRTYSGDISEKQKAKIAKKKEKQAKKAAKETKDDSLMQSLTEKSQLAMDTLKDSVTGLFDQYNPQAIVNGCYEKMETPAVAKKVEEQTKVTIEKYQEKPAEIEQLISTIQAETEAISKININNLKSDPVAIKDAITTINDAYTSVQKVKTETDKLVKSVQTDANNVTSLTKDLQTAIVHDKNLVQNEISKITSLNLDDGKRFISGTFDNIAYQILGKYYPYVKKATDYLVSSKNNNKESEKREKKEKKTTKVVSSVRDRYDGRTVNFNYKENPKLWIKKASGSGPNFSFDALDITNNMDKTGKPVTGTVKLSFAEIDHSAKLIVDTRSESKAPLVSANYNCNKLPLNYPTSKFGDTPGIPGIESTGNLDFILNLYEDDGFDISGTGKFTNMKLSVIPFEPAFASDIYANTLAKIKSMQLQVKGGYTLSKGLLMNINSDADKQFVSALSSEMTKQLSEIKDTAEKEMFAKINEITNGALGEVSSFEDIQKKLNSYSDYVNKISAELENKRKEAENALTNSAKKAVNDVTTKATETAKSKLNSLLKK
ncbi:MAG: TIGR03545 family protein [Treponema sp.]|nr:TIGR03545 family protein [Treponema sp.]